MDDSDFICPLCCEDFDISDREFYPCQCGYQVCMWCWHRIRESESGLCPACRTPYGEDPHQFSAVDVETAIKANKEREAAAKRERQRASQHVDSDDQGSSHQNSNITGIPLPYDAAAPKDRTSLANMRVIRRDLVYAVGLPPHLANEELLRRPDYFGQYGKINKIVINRNQAPGDPRRSSASAYVTFFHKEDTLACILALDGFYLENRNIRASYGTSKYCSAFIKNVRCNNPECTYLHEMGAEEDTFTKQEIQAGYVTSGRDVLARQQQILAEQIRAGTGGPQIRKRIGGGGPSGTGKAATNPVFPVPEYDEPPKPAPALVPPPAGVQRASTTSGVSLNPSNISAKLGRQMSGGKSPTLGAVAAAVPPAIPQPVPAQRSKSTTAASMTANAATTAALVVAGGRPLKSDDGSQSHTTLTPLTPLKRTSKSSANSASTASTVSSRDSSSAPESKMSTLRNGSRKQNGTRAASSAAAAVSASSSAQAAASTNQSSTKSNGTASVSSIGGDVIATPALQPRAANLIGSGALNQAGSGSDVILGFSKKAAEGSSAVDSLGGRPIDLPSKSSAIGAPGKPGAILMGNPTSNGSGPTAPQTGATRSSALGGEVYTGQLHPKTSAIGSSSTTSGNNRWGAAGTTVGAPSSAAALGGTALTPGTALGAGGSSSLWNGSRGGSGSLGGGAGTPLAGVGGSVIGGNRMVVGPPAPSADTTNSSSALASILGINLPTGSGSLQESSSTLWTASAARPPAAPTRMAPPQQQQYSLSALQPGLTGSAALQAQDHRQQQQHSVLSSYGGVRSAGAIGGGGSLAHGSSLIGGVPLTAPGAAVGRPVASQQYQMHGPGTIGSSASTVSNNKSDIALLQSLLPGVHITSGTESFGGGAVGSVGGGRVAGVAPGRQPGWNGAAPGPSLAPAAATGFAHEPLGWNNNGAAASNRMQAVGAIGQNSAMAAAQQNRQARGPGIW